MELWPTFELIMGAEGVEADVLIPLFNSCLLQSKNQRVFSPGNGLILIEHDGPHARPSVPGNVSLKCRQQRQQNENPEGLIIFVSLQYPIVNCGGNIIPHITVFRSVFDIRYEELVLNVDVVLGVPDGSHHGLHDAVLDPVLSTRPVAQAPHDLVKKWF